MADTDPLSADFAKKHPDSFARILGKGSAEDIVAVLGKLPPDVAASIVSRLPASRVSGLLASGQAAEVRWLTHAPLNDAVALLSRIPREKSLAIVNKVRNRERRRRLLQFLKYPAHSLGALVSDAPVRVTVDTRAADVVAELRALDTADPGLLVVVQPDGRYLGVLDLWALFVTDPPVGAISEYVKSVSALYPETTLASAVQNKLWNEHNWLPVVDQEQNILGGVSRASVFKAARQEAGASRPWGDLFSLLIVDVVSLFGNLLESLLGERRRT